MFKNDEMNFNMYHTRHCGVAGRLHEEAVIDTSTTRTDLMMPGLLK